MSLLSDRCHEINALHITPVPLFGELFKWHISCLQIVVLPGLVHCFFHLSLSVLRRWFQCSFFLSILGQNHILNAFHGQKSLTLSNIWLLGSLYSWTIINLNFAIIDVSSVSEKAAHFLLGMNIIPSDHGPAAHTSGVMFLRWAKGLTFLPSR